MRTLCPILRRHGLATSLVADNPAKRTADPPARLRPGGMLRVEACNPRQPGLMGQGPTSTPSPVRQFSHWSCRVLSCTRSLANLCWYLLRPFRTVRQLLGNKQLWPRPHSSTETSAMSLASSSVPRRLRRPFSSTRLTARHFSHWPCRSAVSAGSPMR